MHSPPAEWALAIGHLAILDYVRARGEADSDTISEVVRAVVRGTPHGELWLAAGLAAGAVAFHRHICGYQPEGHHGTL